MKTSKRDNSQWTHVRLKRTVYERLQAWMSQYWCSATKGKAPMVIGERDFLTVSLAIGILLDRDTSHKARRKKAADKKRERAQRSLPDMPK